MTTNDSSKKETRFSQIKIFCGQFKRLLTQGRIDATLPESRTLIPDDVRDSISDLNEAQIRQSFILPLISALGWNSEDPFEVFPEERSNGGFIDIRLRTPTGDSIIWEIKRTSVSLDLGSESGKEAAYQGVGYARTFTSAPFCVVTNFESLLIFHSYSLPPKERIMENLVAKYSWIELKEGHADSTLEQLSKAATLNGSFRDYFDKAIKNKAILRIRRPLEDRILADLEKWRLTISQELLRLSPNSTLLEIDLSTQTLINRLLFIRSCEDRKLESENKSQLIIENEHKWNFMCSKVFPYYKASYNSDLFAIDSLIDDPSLDFSNKKLKEIIQETYSGSGVDTHEIYDFSIIPLEVLGAAYESYLAKQLIKEKGKLALVLKPELAKSGGVHYTPAYIVEEIVNRTIGRLEQNEGRAFLPKILDPACGSGTFLIQALRFIVETNRPAPEKKSLKRKVLTLKEKKEILEKCIFGVDLDKKAVEITKLSLLLLLLEGIQEGLIFKSVLLPSLDKNIRSGNSLITPEAAVRVLSNPNLKDLRPLDWETFKNSCGASKGFDAVIGNPPYIRIQVLQEFYPEATQVYTSEFLTAKSGGVDIYLPFIELALSLTTKKGYLGYILPTRFWLNEYGKAARELIADKVSFFEAVNFRAEQVFKATTYTCILALSKSGEKVVRLFEPPQQGIPCNQFLTEIAKDESSLLNIIPEDSLSESPWLLAPNSIRERVLSLENSPKKLSDYINEETGVFQGLINGKDSVFLLEKTEKDLYSQELDCKVEIERELVFPLLKGSADLKRYVTPNPSLRLFYPYIKNTSDVENNENVDLIDCYEMVERFPNAFTYLMANEEVLRFRNSLATAKVRADEIKANPSKYPIDPENPSRRIWFYDKDDFYKYSRNQALDCVRKPKILVPSLFKEPAFFWDENGQYAITGSGSGGGGAYAMYLKEEFISRAYQLIGILNSSVLQEWFERRGDLFSGYYVGVDEKSLLSVPLPDLDAEENQKDLALVGSLVLQIHRNPDGTLFTELSNSIDGVVRRLYKI